MVQLTDNKKTSKNIRIFPTLFSDRGCVHLYTPSTSGRSTEWRTSSREMESYAECKVIPGNLYFYTILFIYFMLLLAKHQSIACPSIVIQVRLFTSRRESI